MLGGIAQKFQFQNQNSSNLHCGLTHFLRKCFTCKFMIGVTPGPGAVIAFVSKAYGRLPDKAIFEKGGDLDLF